jgi:uncharacterized protein (TIGR00251 family)
VSYLQDTPSGCLISVRVTPRAGRTAVAGVREGQLVVKLAAAPVDGAANEALIEAIAGALRVPKRDVSIASGDRSRSKRVLVSNRTAAAVEAALAPLLAER